MGKRSRRTRSDSRSDSEETIRKQAKKYRRERRREKESQSSREKDDKKDSRKKRKGEDPGGDDSGHEKEKRKARKAEKRAKKAEKAAKKKDEEEKLLEERRQRLKLWKARQGIKEEQKSEPKEEQKATPAATPSDTSEKKPAIDPIMAQLAAIKARLAKKKATEEANVSNGEATKAPEPATEPSEMSVEKASSAGEDKNISTVAAAVSAAADSTAATGSESTAGAADESAADAGGAAMEMDGAVAPQAAIKAPAAPKLKVPKKWVAAVYELIGTDEFEGAPFLGTFVEDSEFKGKVYRERGGKLFLYYWRPKRQWIIGDNYSSELGLVFVNTLARTPDQIARPWSFFDGETQEWIETDDLLLRRLPTKEETDAWAKSREPEKVELKGPEDKFDGAPFMGAYTEIIGYNPPVYRHESGHFYLYFWKLKKQWIVGKDWKTDQGPFMFVESEAPSPYKIHTYWNYWDPDTGEWECDEDIWCPKAGFKTEDEGVEQVDAETAALEMQKAIEEMNKRAEEGEKKKKEGGESDSKQPEGESSEVKVKDGDDGDEEKSMQVEGSGDEGQDEKVVDGKTVDSNNDKEENPDDDADGAGAVADADSGAGGGADDGADVDPLEQFMSKISSAKTDAEREAAIGKKKRRRKREHKQAMELAKQQAAKIDIYEEETMFDEKDIKKKTKDMMSWLEKNKPKLKDLKPVDHSKMEYEPFKKKFYIESPEIAFMTPDEVVEMCKKELDNVRIRGKNCPKPIKKWTHCGLPKKIYRTLERLEYTKPFPIQATAIPAIMDGRDVIGIAKTGSGKTLAFLLPMFRHILDQRPLEKGEGPISVILAPTRELAIQIHLEARKFAKPLGLRPVCVYGGASVAEQIAELKRGAEIITGTPGRMIDLLCANSGRVTNLTRVTYLVLDEADRMFDLGFEPQIMRVVQNVRPGRQTVMFSATFPRIVEKLAKVCMKQPIEIMIGGRSVAADNVTQFVEVREPDSRFKRLLEILGKWYSRGSILVFCNKKDEVDFLFQQLIDAGYPCFSVHGDMDQTDRDYAIMDFRKGLRSLMVATSIIARGLDVKDLKLVVNYDAPTHYEDYVHRIGRTGRAGKKGTAITFLSEEEEQLALDLVVGLTKAKQVIPKDLQKLADDFKAKVSRGEATYYSNKGYDGRGHKFDEEEAIAQANRKHWERVGYGAEEKTDDDYLMEEQMRIEEAKKKAEKEAKQLEEIDPIKQQMAAAKRAAQVAKKVLKEKEQDEEQAKTALLAAKIAVAKTMAESNVAPVLTTAAAKAARVAAEIRRHLKSGPMGNGEGAYFTDEIEINDYPQYARYKMTQRSVVVDIEERYECTITTKGTFIPAGRKVKEGQRKLWLQIEGKTQVDVLRCKADIRRTLEESASMRPDSNDRRSGGGKYQVLSLTY